MVAAATRAQKCARLSSGTMYTDRY